MSPVAAGELANLGDAVVAPLGDYVAGDELAPEVRPFRVAAHEDDLLGAKALRGEHGEKTDRAVADDGDRGSLVDPTLDGGVVARTENVGQCEKRREQLQVLSDAGCRAV